MPVKIDVPMPDRMKKLPVDHRGYPVPWFVQWVHGEGNDMEPATPGEGRPEFRMMDSTKWVRAVEAKLCWVCGERMGRHCAFVIGPMCAVNRTTAEPPCHLDCAVFSARACPFLSIPKMHRHEDRLPDERSSPGIAIKRNPGVALVWVTEQRKWRVFNDGNGKWLIDIGKKPNDTLWFAHGREATRDEIMESIETGLPLLREVAEKEGDLALAQLDQQTAEALVYVPAAA